MKSFCLATLLSALTSIVFCAGCAHTTTVKTETAPTPKTEAVEEATPQVLKPLVLAENERLLFDGASLAGWAICEENAFEDHGPVTVQSGAIVMGKGRPMTGIAWTGDFPRNDYEVEMLAKRVEGSDFFCGMTFPVGEAYCTLILGGWGGSLVGLSNIDTYSAAENSTTRGENFEQGRWYRVRLRVTDAAIQAWLDEEEIIDQERAGHEFSIWWEQEPARPFGINTYYTVGALKDMVLRPAR
jgi:hypothetical protein